MKFSARLCIIFLIINNLASICNAQNTNSTIKVNCGSSLQMMTNFNDVYHNCLKAKKERVPIPPFPYDIKNFTLQEDFPITKIVRCGNFRLYFEDSLHPDTLIGFAQPNNQLGLIRQNALCNTISYVQSIIKIETTDTIDLYIARSFEGLNPIPIGSTYLAAAGPFFPDSTFGYHQGCFPGNVYSHILNNFDPDTTNYDGYIIFNFDKIGSDYIPFAYQGSSINDSCNSFDFCSVALHELTHALGWFSGIQAKTDFAHFMCPTTLLNSNSFSLYDSIFLYYREIKSQSVFEKLVVTDTNNKPVINPLLVNNVGLLSSSSIWLNDNENSSNQPVYSGDFGNSNFINFPGSVLSHLSLDELSFPNMAQFLPGFFVRYVMGPVFYPTTTDDRKNWTIQELRILQLLGYSFTNQFNNSLSLNSYDTNSFLLSNIPPNRINFKRSISYPTSYNISFPDTTFSDTSLINYNTLQNPSATSITVNISQSNLFTDINNDTIKIMPNTIFGIRGVSSYGNNHDQISISPDYRSFTFTPLPDYSGRAQFGFNVWDGHEIGAFYVYTIDIKDGIDSIYPLKELVINGSYEDGTEVKIANNSEWNKRYSSAFESYEGEYCGGSYYSGGHAFSQISNIRTISGGDIVHNSWSNSCEFGGNLFGHWGNGTSLLNVNNNSNPFPNFLQDSTNARYHVLSGSKNFCTLTDTILPKREYLFQCDLCFSSLYYQNNDTFNFQLQFNTQPLPDATLTDVFQTDYFSLVIDSVTNVSNREGKWMHFMDTIIYCGEPVKNISLINPNNYLYIQNTYPVFIDNISLKLVTALPDSIILINLSASDTISCFGEPILIEANPINFFNNLNYQWSPGNQSTKSIIVTPTTSTTYFVTVSNGCVSVIDSIKIRVLPKPLIAITYDQPVCVGGSLNLHANLNLPGGVGFHWVGPNGFTSQIQDPSLTPAGINLNGTYFLTVTDSSGCTNTDSLTFTIDTNYVAHGYPSYYYDCPSNSLSLYASNGYSNYFWYGPDNYMSVDQNPIIEDINQSNNGYYYLFVVSNSGCYGFDSVLVNALRTNDLSLETNAPICMHDTLRLLSASGITFLWTGPNGYTSSLQNPLIINADTSSAGKYYCYMTDLTGCHYNDLPVEIHYCCSDSIVTFLTYDKISAYSSSLPLHIAISGELNINMNYAFNPGSTIVMLPKSSINIWSNVNLNIDSSYVHGCQELWGTIQVQDFAGLTLTNSVIEDAEYAITAYEKPNLKITNNHFHKNYVGFYVPEPIPWSNMRTFGSLNFHGNEFDCKNDVLLYPKAGQKSMAGVLLNSELLVSLYGSSVNSYHHMRNGIIAHNTNLEVENSKFFDLSDTIPDSGCGIYVESYNHPFNLIQHGWGTSTDTSFQSCNYGIRAITMNNEIRYNLMHYVDNGVTISVSPYSYQDISKNYLECRDRGIFLAMNDPVMRTEIYNNTIKMNSSHTPASTSAIFVYEWRNAPINYAKIHNNIIEMDTCSFGIKLQSACNTEVYENYITMNKPFQNYYGIVLDYCPQSTVSCNDVYGINPALGQSTLKTPRGMRVNESATSKFSCNNFANTKIGASFENRCYDDSIRGNTFYNHEWGLHYSKYAITGPQKHQGNMWFGSYTLAAKHEDSSYSYVNQSQYRCKFNPLYYFPPSVNPASGWFFQAGDSSTYSCTICPKEKSLFSNDSILSPIDYAIANGTTWMEEYIPESKWISSRFLFNKLVSDSLLVTANSIMANFYDSTQLVSAGKYQKVEIDYKKAFVLDIISRSFLDTLSQQIFTTLHSIKLTDSLLLSVTSFNDSLELLIEKEILIYTLGGLNEQLSAAIQGVKYIQEPKINALIMQNGLLPSTEIFEENEKAINEIYLNTIAKGSYGFSEEQNFIINEIANQCPLSGGNAVYLARSLYALNHSDLYDDQLICLAAGIKSKPVIKDSLHNKSEDFNIYPNPTNDILFVEWNTPRDTKATLSIINDLGQQVFQKDFNLADRIFKTELGFLPSGAYRVCISISNEKTMCEKIIVLKP